MHRTIALPHHLAESLREQVKQDANFLAGHGIIDYSLLVGVHNRGRDADAHGGSLSPAPSTSRPPATPRTPETCAAGNVAPSPAGATAAGAATAASCAASAREQRLQALAGLKGGLQGLGHQTSPEQRQRVEQKERWVSQHIGELERKYRLLTGKGKESAGAMAAKSEAHPSTSLRRERSSPAEIQRKQLELMEQLEHDPDNAVLLEQVKNLHSELVITVSQELELELEPEPEPKQLTLELGAVVCDMLSWNDFIEIAFACSSSGIAHASPLQPQVTVKHGEQAYAEARNGAADKGGLSCVDSTATLPFMSRVSGPPASIFAQHQGGMQALTYRPGCRATPLENEHESDVVFLGIIDTLVPFKLRKKVRT